MLSGFPAALKTSLHDQAVARFAARDCFVRLPKLQAANRLIEECFFYRVFQNVGNLGLFLFNDCLILAIKNLTAVPFQRILEITYK